MQVFFDTNVYIAESLLGAAAESMLVATSSAAWRIFVNEHVLDEIETVLTEQLGFSKRLAKLARGHCQRRAIHVKESSSRHKVRDDPADSPILRAAVTAGVDYLVTNDRHLLDLNPYESVRIVSMDAYYELLETEGLLTETKSPS